MMGKDYIAEITGPDEKFILKRRFLSRFESPVSESGNFYEECVKGEKRYFLVDEEGEQVEFTKEQVVAAINPAKVLHFNSRLPLYPFQEDGAKFLASHKKAMLADDMGLGKTRQALAAIQQFPVLIVCPASVKYEWRRQAEEAYPEHIVTVLSGRTPSAISSSDIIIINYDVLDDWVRALANETIYTVIADESHYLKNGSAERSKALRDLVFEKKYPYRYLLTGTPIVSGPQDLYNQLLIMGKLPEGHWKKRDFLEDYCGAYWNGKYWEFHPNHEQLEDLKFHMTTCSLNRSKTDVLPDLPERGEYTFHFSRDIVSLDYLDAQTDFLSWYQEETGKDLSGNDAQAMVRMQKLLELSEFDRVNSAEFKEWIESFGNRPVVITYRFKKSLAVLKGFLGKQAYYYDGSVSPEEKSVMVADFQAGNKQFFVGQVEAMKTGITLTRSADMVFLSLPWSDADYRQCGDRIYRIGQENKVAIWIMATDELWIDQVMLKIVKDKKKLSDAIMEGDK